MITVQGPPDSLSAIIAAFRETAGADAPVYIQSHISWADSDEEARANAFDQWRFNITAGDLGADLRSVRHFKAATVHVRPEDLALGVQGIFLHNVGRNQEQFIDTFGERVLPEFATGEAGRP